ncbi:MAG TPA: NAD(P) transhydrogenase subunit alpha [Gammaproteobacteria bacterium]|jgi:NAD(P) transhydrogenase subunit alpha|nr:NAD(P) transhydrogenase subunit alpha [Gammaproteobacteria bacterium]
MPVCIGVLKEISVHEARVALTPDVAAKFSELGATVALQRGAGERSHFADAAYKGAQLAAAAAEVLGSANVLLKVQPPSLEEIDALAPGSVVVGFLQAHRELEMVRRLRDRRITSFAVEFIPRISRAQSMDALSSQAAVAGYKAALLAANALDKFLPMLTTAAGTIRPAQVLVIGAGVAGLQAIATSRRLGAVVEAYDVRSATKEQIQSLGAKFVDTGVAAEGTGGYARELTAEEKAKQQAVLDSHIAKADAVITTAAIPGRTAPRIISKAAVAAMGAGAVIVDLAAESGGNCELTVAGETIVTDNGVKILGPRNLPSELARHASQMYARNLLNFLQPALKGGALAIDWQDEVFAQSVLTHDGEVRHAGTAKLLG